MGGPRRRVALAGMVAVFGLLGVACSAEEAGEAGSQTGSSVVETTSTAPPPGRAAVPPTSGVDVPAEVSAVRERVGSQLSLTDEQWSCLAIELGEQPDLVATLGDAPTESERFGELRQLALKCVSSTTGAREFAANIAGQVSGGLSEERIACLRDGYAGLSEEQIRLITQDVVADPLTEDPAAVAVIDDLLGACGLSRSDLMPA